MEKMRSQYGKSKFQRRLSLFFVFLMTIAALMFTACDDNKDPGELDQIGTVTGIELSEEGNLKWNAYRGAESYNIRIGIKSQKTTATVYDLKTFSLTDGEYNAGVFANKSDDEVELAFGNLKFTLNKGVYSTDGGPVDPGPVDPGPVDEEKLAAPEMTLVENVFSWGAVPGATEYLLTLNGTEHEIPSAQKSYTFAHMAVGDYIATIQAIAAEAKYNSDAVSKEFTFNLFAAGDGTEQSPYEIKTPEQFGRIAKFTEYHYAIPTEHSLDGTVLAVEMPKDKSNRKIPFTGTLKAESDAEIKNVQLPSASWFDLGESGVMEGLNLTSVHNTDKFYPLIGENRGIVRNCTVSGEFNGSTDGRYPVLVSENSGQIKKCSVVGTAKGFVTAVEINSKDAVISELSVDLLLTADNVTGGHQNKNALINFNYYGVAVCSNSGLIENSGVNGSLSFNLKFEGNSFGYGSPSSFGTFIGENAGTIRICRSSASLSGTFDDRYDSVMIGGFAGSNKNQQTAMISQCAYSGELSLRVDRGMGGLSIGGFIGSVYQGRVEHCLAERQTVVSCFQSEFNNWSIAWGRYGGFAGENGASVSDCYAAGLSITGNLNNEKFKKDPFTVKSGNGTNDGCHTSSDQNFVMDEDYWFVPYGGTPNLSVFYEAIQDACVPVVTGNVLSWEPVENADFYEYVLYGIKYITRETSVTLAFTQGGITEVTLRAGSSERPVGPWASAEFDVKTLTFAVETAGQTQNQKVYRALGQTYLFDVSGCLKTGHTLTAWSSGDVSYDVGGSLGVSSDMSFSAVWTINEYLFKVYLKDTEKQWVTAKSQSLEYDSVFELPQAVIEGYDAKGYAFDGWYTDQNLLNPLNISKIPAKDLSVYAKFTLKKFNLVLDPNDDSGAVNSSEREYYGMLTVGGLTEFERKGYTFEGWYTDAACTVAAVDFRMPAEEVRLYANWTLNTYRITVVPEGGTFDGEIPETFTVEADALSLPQAQKRGYTFDGWSVNGSEEVKTVLEKGYYAEDLILKAVFTANKYTVNYDCNGGTQSYTVTFDTSAYPEARKVSSQTIKGKQTLQVPPEYIPYIHEGWYLTPDFAGKPYDFRTPVTSDLTLYLKAFRMTDQSASRYEQLLTDGAYGILRGEERASSTFTRSQEYLDYKFVASVDGTFYLDAEFVRKFSKEYADVGATLRRLDRVGETIIHRFNWIDGLANHGNGISQSIDPKDHYVTLQKGEAYWLQISFVSNEESSTEFSMRINNGSYVSGGGGILESKPISFDSAFGALPAPQKFGYTFTGWTCGDRIIDPSTVMDYDGNITLTAQYEIITSKIEYILNGGANGAGNPSSYTILDGTILLADAFKDGYRFMGWYRDSEFKNKIESLAYDDDPNGIRLYARFDKLYSVSFVNPGQIAAPESVNRIASESYQLPAMEAEEFRFKGWYFDQEFTKPVSVISGLAEDVTVYGKFYKYYSILSVANGGTLEGSFEQYTLEDRTELTLECLRENSLFVGWYSDRELTNKIEEIPVGTDYDVTIYAKYDHSTDGLVFTAVPGENGYAVSVPAGASLGEPNVVIPRYYKGKPVLTVNQIGSASTVIVSVSIPDTVTAIGDSAFAGCAGLAQILLPDGLISIGASAFQGCGGLSEIVVPGGVTSIGASAFAGCGALTKITVPFAGAALGGTANTHFGYIFGADSASGQGLAIPSMLRTVTVTGGLSIGDSAFAGCAGLNEIFLSASIASVGDSAFRGCSGLNEIVVPEGVTSIGASAFDGCNSLTKITIPFVGAALDGTANTHFGYIFGANSASGQAVSIPSCMRTVIVTGGSSIGAGAFAGCAGLTEIKIPASIASVGEKAFQGCNGIDEIVVSPQNLNYRFSGNCLIETATKILIAGFKHSIIPADGSVTLIAGYAFADCVGLTQIVITDHITSIGFGAFEGCSSLAEMSVPFVGNSPIGSQNSNFGYIFGAGAFYLNNTYLPQTLKSLTVTKAVSVYKNAFYNCQYLQTIAFEDGLIEIGDSAFPSCWALVKIVLPEGVTSIGNSALEDCSALKELILPEGLISIGDAAFSKCYKLTKIVVPGSVTSIGKGALGNCGSLAEIVVSGQNTKYSSAGNCLIEISSKTLIAGCKTSVIPDDGSVTAIGDSAFANSSLNTLEISNHIVSIGVQAFEGCKMTELVIPAGVTSIGKSAFSGCDQLTTLTVPYVGGSLNDAETAYFGYIFGADYFGYNQDKVPASLQTVTVLNGNIDQHAFYECGMTAINLVGTERINQSAFNFCESLTTISLGEKLKVIEGYAFSDCHALTGIVIPDSVETIGTAAFQNCYNLSEIKLPNGLKELTESLFVGCGKLTNIIIPETVTSIGATVFKNSGLKSVTIPAGVAVIDESAFDSLVLTEILISDQNPIYIVIGNTLVEKSTKKLILAGLGGVIPADGSVTAVGAYAFRGHVELTEFEIPESVLSLHKSAFNGCGFLIKMTLPATMLSSIDLSGLRTIIISSAESFEYNVLNKARLLVHLTLPFVGATRDGETNNFLGYLFGATKIIEQKIFIPASLRSVTVEGGKIAPAAFRDCTNLTTITLLDGVTSIGSSAFENCTGLQELTVPFVGATPGGTENTHFGYIFGATSYTNQGSILPQGLSLTVTGSSDIASYAFNGCARLNEINLSDDITSIGNRAFFECGGLTRFKLPRGVLAIGENTFYQCGNLSEIELHSGVTYIGQSAFEGCGGLTKITIPASVTNMGRNAFKACNALIFYAETKAAPSGWNQWNTNDRPVVWDCNNNDLDADGFVYAHMDGVVYQIADGQATLVCAGASAREIIMPEFLVLKGQSIPVVKIGYKAFWGNTTVVSVIVSDSVTEIGDYAFNSCRNFVNLVFGKNVTTLGSYAISYCDALENLTIGLSVTTVKASAISSCTKLQVYVEANEKPQGWDDAWINTNKPIIWDCKNV